METTQLQVTGMTCGMCVQHVTQALQEVPGVRAAKVDLASGSATVEHDGATRTALLQAVAEAGYEAEIAPAPAQAQAATTEEESCSCCSPQPAVVTAAAPQEACAPQDESCGCCTNNGRF